MKTAKIAILLTLSGASLFVLAGTNDAAQSSQPAVRGMMPSTQPLELALRGIHLSPSANDQDAREYVDRLLAVSRTHTYVSPHDREVPLLVMVGPGRLGILIDALGERPATWAADEHLMAAIKHLAAEEHKELIIRRLSDRPTLIEVILDKGWEYDARNVLVDAVVAFGKQFVPEASPEAEADRSRSVPSAWFVAVCRLKDPRTYDGLRAYFTMCQFPSYACDVLEHLPDFDLGRAVAEGWTAAKSGRLRPDAKPPMASIAVGYGHLDALEFLVGKLMDQTERSHFWDPRYALYAIRDHTDYLGPYANVGDWFKRNKDSLAWDKEKRIFVTKGQ